MMYRFSEQARTNNRSRTTPTSLGQGNRPTSRVGCAAGRRSLPAIVLKKMTMGGVTVAVGPGSDAQSRVGVPLLDSERLSRSSGCRSA